MATAAKLSAVQSTAESKHLNQIESVARGTHLGDGLEAVSDSWRRCTSDLIVNPESRSAPHIVTDRELSGFRDPLNKAITAAQEEIDRLYAIVRQEGYVVLLCNAEGVAIHHRGDEAQAEQFKYWGIWLGGVWSEKIEGTNGIGTCIAEKRPILVHRQQHFRARHIGLSCAGAPIFGPDGELALVLDTSAMNSNEAQALALAATKVAARGIEERLFRAHFRNLWVISAAPFDDSSPALLLAVDTDLRIVGADRPARMTFSLDEETLGRGMLLSAIFDFERTAFHCKHEQDVPSRFLHVATAEPWRALITPPLCGTRGWRSAAELAIHSRPRISLLNEIPLSQPAAPARGGLPPARAQRICEFIEANLDQNISLESLAEMAGLSTHHFARAFKQTLGMPPHCYVLQRRIERAQQMLRDTDLSLSEIALSAGFSDQSHLTRHFRRLTGVPPSVMRWDRQR
jgi:AraC-like DNA-binding protein